MLILIGFIVFNGLTKEVICQCQSHKKSIFMKLKLVFKGLANHRSNFYSKQNRNNHLHLSCRTHLAHRNTWFMVDRFNRKDKGQTSNCKYHFLYGKTMKLWTYGTSVKIPPSTLQVWQKQQNKSEMWKSHNPSLIWEKREKMSKQPFPSLSFHKREWI